MQDAKLIIQLQAAGVASDDHHMKIKKAVEEVTGGKPDKAEYQRLKNLLSEAEAEQDEGEQLSPEELRAKAEALVDQRAKDPEAPGWENVIEVVKVTDTGKPARVWIECQMQDEEVCDGTREIAAQDVFQVSRCIPCQKRSINRRRRERRKDRAEAAQVKDHF